LAGNVVQELVQILRDVLRLGARADRMDASTPLLGGLPEFDSMAVVSVVTALEEHYGFAFDDDEIRGEAFETVGSLAALVEAKLGA
jgi:acyl carrier protein